MTSRTTASTKTTAKNPKESVVKRQDERLRMIPRMTVEELSNMLPHASQD